ncbi:MAG: hypothetical protein MUQ30_04995 [Anaerolineae bacterium]|nr:hypothetical protein [Anaerolineae bacterium]
MTRTSVRRWGNTACAGALMLLLSLLAAQPAVTQDGSPECPSGFVWQRMSGVGCVQENCFDIANAKLSYTSSCICLDGYRPCYELIDTSGIACDPFCPASQLVACVASDALCPGEQPAQPAGTQPQQPADVQTGDGAALEAPGTTVDNAPSSGDPDISVSVPDLV